MKLWLIMITVQIMTMDDQIKDINRDMILIEKLQKYQHYNYAKFNEYQYLTSEEILPSNQKQIIQEANLVAIL